MTPATPIQVALLVAEILDRLGVTYVLGGSIASTVHGEPRATLDVDLAAALSEEHVEPLVDQLGDGFYVSPEGVKAAVRERRSFNLIHLGSMVKVDIFVPPDTGIHPEKWKRRQRLVLQEEPERSAWVTDPEDIVLQKLDWFRQGVGASDSQWRDVLGVLKTQTNRLDRVYLAEWAERMGLTDLLERALAEAAAPQGER